MADIGGVIDRLVTRTKAGALPWRPHFRDSTTLVTDLESAVVWLSIDTDGDKVVSIRDSGGHVLEEINTGYREHWVHKDNVNNLYELARRQAFQVDEKLESLFEELGK